MRNKNLQSGQVLLVAIMLIATVITVVMSSVFKSNTETQITKLEEDSQKGLAAAESGVEQALREKATVDVNIGDYSGRAMVSQSNTNSPTTYESPRIPTDQQYTFYLSDYSRPTDTDPQNFSNPFNGDLTICFDKESGGTVPALEITLVKNDNTLTRVIVDPLAGNANRIQGTNVYAGNTGACPSGPSGYNHYYQLGNMSGQYKLLLARVLFSQSRLGFVTIAPSSLNTQAVVIDSNVTNTKTGVTKQIELTQSNPQIPADFFVTQF